MSDIEQQLIDKIDQMDKRIIILETTGKERVFTGGVETTDATVTPIYVFSTSSNVAYTLEYTITAGRTDVVGDTASYHRKIKAKNIGGVVTTLFLRQAATADDTNYLREDAAAWATTIAVVGTTVEIRVTGVALQTIKWTMRATVLQLSLT